MWTNLRKQATAGAAIAALALTALFRRDGALSDAFFLYEALPFIDMAAVSATAPDAPDAQPPAQDDHAAPPPPAAPQASAPPQAALPPAVPAALEPVFAQGVVEVVGAALQDAPAPGAAAPFGAFGADELSQIAYLKQNLYTVDPGTELYASDIDPQAFLSADMRVRPGQKVLIFHTHMYEAFADSREGVPEDGVFGTGERLAARLRSYGIETIHVAERFDVVDGGVNVLGAYERMEPYIRALLAADPSIAVAVDLHRDGVPGDEKAVALIDGQPSAKLMFFNGMSRLKTGGVVSNLASLPNPNLQYNLAFSFRAQMAANRLYPGLAKKIYLKAYRYSLHMLPKSTLVEIGNQNNTVAEAMRAMDALGDVLADVLLR